MTETFEQVPFADVGLVDNPEPRCACLLLLDNSGSMRGNPISELNRGLKVFRDELAADALASKRVEVADRHLWTSEDRDRLYQRSEFYCSDALCCRRYPDGAGYRNWLEYASKSKGRL